MDPLLQDQETGVQLQLSLEDPLSSLKWSPPSKQKEGLSPALMRRKLLPYPGHLPTPIIHQSSILFCRDSRSFCEALISSHSRTFSIHSSINSILSSIVIQWIRGHSSIPGNDLADKATKGATTIASNAILPISMFSSIQVINDMICDAPPTHERIAAVYHHRRVF